MSLLSAIIIPQLEKELIAMEPAIAQFMLKQFKAAGADVMDWIEKKIEPEALKMNVQEDIPL